MRTNTGSFAVFFYTERRFRIFCVVTENNIVGGGQCCLTQFHKASLLCHIFMCGASFSTRLFSHHGHPVNPDLTCPQPTPRWQNYYWSFWIIIYSSLMKCLNQSDERIRTEEKIFLTVMEFSNWLRITHWQIKAKGFPARWVKCCGFIAENLVCTGIPPVFMLCEPQVICCYDNFFDVSPPQ